MIKIMSRNLISMFTVVIHSTGRSEAMHIVINSEAAALCFESLVKISLDDISDDTV